MYFENWTIKFKNFGQKFANWLGIFFISQTKCNKTVNRGKLSLYTILSVALYMTFNLQNTIFRTVAIQKFGRLWKIWKNFARYPSEIIKEILYFLLNQIFHKDLGLVGWRLGLLGWRGWGCGGRPIVVAGWVKAVPGAVDGSRDGLPGSWCALRLKLPIDIPDQWPVC